VVERKACQGYREWSAFGRLQYVASLKITPGE
jgi:hypothetical protein